MTKEKALDRITKASKMAGFTVEESNWSMIGINIRAEYLNFTIHKDVHWDVKNHTITEKLIATASISQMGGNPTSDELLKASDEIKRGAILVQQINNWNLEYVVEM